MTSSGRDATLGVVVIHDPGEPVPDLPAVRDLIGQVGELLLVFNGREGRQAAVVEPGPHGIRSITFDANRGTAAAWNAALSWAADAGFRYLYVLDQDSAPAPDAVGAALAHMDGNGTAAVVQPPADNGSRLDRFPWNTVASGSLYRVDALRVVGGFDERLFVDQADQELLGRLLDTGHRVEVLEAATIRHCAGSPRPIRLLGRVAVVSNHGPERRWLQGFSAGLLVRRHVAGAPSTSSRVLVRHAWNAAKDAIAGDFASTRAFVAGLAGGLTTARPPERAAERACPYCEGPLVGRFGNVPDWLFGTDVVADVYLCPKCRALAAGRVPAAQEVASWYSQYYTHSFDHRPPRLWSHWWPTPGRRREMQAMRRYFAAPSDVGRFLEVGTGLGERLVDFAEEGWEVLGQDLDPKAGSAALERGIRVHYGPITDLVGAERPFDLIGLSHVLEHVADPGELLRACVALLTPRGRLCVVAPNADSLGRRLFGRWWFGLDQPRHLAIPSRASIVRLAARLGLRTIRLETVATNAAVILGGSLARAPQEHVRARVPQEIVRASTAFAGQAIGRAAVAANSGLGEEIVWVAQRGDG